MDLRLEVGDVLGVDQVIGRRRHGILPDQHFGGNLRAEVAHARTHVAVGQLEPGPCESVGEGRRVFVEPARDRLIGRVEAQGQIRRGHHRRGLLGRIMRVGDHVLRTAVLRVPLMGAGGALVEFPLIAEEHVEIAVVPLGGVGLPGAFDAAGDGVHALAAAEVALPSKAHLLHGSRFRLTAHMVLGASAMRLAEGVAARHQSDGFLVVHGHAREGLAHVATGGDRVGIAVRALRVDVDQAHLHGAEGIIQHAVAGVALVAQPDVLVAPVDVLLGLPDVGAAARETEGLEAHGLQRAVARQDHQIGPGDLVAILLLDRPQQTAGLVEVDVIRPAVQGREALRTRAAAAATIRDAIGARAVPGHADEEPAVMAPVRRPPGLGIRHQGVDVALQRRQIELLELLGVVEGLAHGVGQGGVLVKNVEIELVRPPVLVGPAGMGRVRGRPMHHRALAQAGRFAVIHCYSLHSTCCVEFGPEQPCRLLLLFQCVDHEALVACVDQSRIPLQCNGDMSLAVAPCGYATKI